MLRNGTSFIKVYIEMTTIVRFFLTHGTIVFADRPLDTLSKCSRMSRV